LLLLGLFSQFGLDGEVGMVASMRMMSSSMRVGVLSSTELYQASE
jgi:spore maturation protein SpmB